MDLSPGIYSLFYGIAGNVKPALHLWTTLAKRDQPRRPAAIIGGRPCRIVAAANVEQWRQFIVRKLEATSVYDSRDKINIQQVNFG